MTKPLVNKRLKLERFPGKGGWTFARVPDVIQGKGKPFGWVRVKGSIDGYKISQCHVMPMGDGKLFLPVRAEIRKKIQKEAGDWVHVILYRDQQRLKISDELVDCLKDEPESFEFFRSLSDSEQNAYIKWIYSAKREETKAERIAACINRLLKGLKLYDKL